MVHVKWEPFRDLMAMQDRMTRLFDETLSHIWKEEVPPRIWSPPVDILERENEVILKVDLPEMNQNDIEIKVEENTLIIRGERKFIQETPHGNYLQIERPYGTFQRTFAIPRMIDLEKIKAAYKDGVLRIVLPKKEEVHPKQIVVEES
jgi:HSP20 family protein